jgi:hypothetical protein
VWSSWVASYPSELHRWSPAGWIWHAFDLPNHAAGEEEAYHDERRWYNSSGRQGMRLDQVRLLAVAAGQHSNGGRKRPSLGANFMERLLARIWSVAFWGLLGAVLGGILGVGGFVLLDWLNPRLGLEPKLSLTAGLVGLLLGAASGGLFGAVWTLPASVRSGGADQERTGDR